MICGLNCGTLKQISHGAKDVKLLYYNGKEKEIEASNFGDELNPWLWPRLLPNAFDQDASSLFVGIGTLLNEHLPQQPKKIIFGSGVGYGKTPQVDSTWKIYFVRGQLSAKALEIQPEMGLTDPAILVRQFFKPTGQKKYRQAYIPHFTESLYNGSAWKALCQSLNLHYIDPTQPVEQVLSEIACSEILFAEAMHGAIVADALRVPWVAVKTKRDILDFKWSDWLSSVQLSYQPATIKRVSSIISQKDPLRYFDYQSIRIQMSLMLKTAKFSLSKESKSRELEEKVMLNLETLKRDFSLG